ncbi:MAG: SLC13 family permease, partial [Gemmatimonadetes bacterium]|nr:SLC13 family permease [Gemmatimonadota bacterium]
MSIDGWIAIGILFASGFTILKRWAPTELVALGIPVLLVLTGVLEPAEALQGFGNHAVIAIAAVFVVGAGLSGSGLAGLVARFILRLAGQRESTILALLMGAAALVSGFMSNAATTALFLPTAVTLSRRALISPSRLLMPLAAASVLGGTLTMIGTPPNLIVSAFREARTGDAFSVLDFTRVAIPIVLMGILYTVTVGRKLLPVRTSHDRLREALLPEAIAESYGVARNLARLKIGSPSEVAGRTIAEVDIRRRYGLSVVLVNRHIGPVSRYFDPRPDLRLEEGDVLYVEGEDEAAWRFGEEKGLQYGLAGPRALER